MLNVEVKDFCGSKFIILHSKIKNIANDAVCIYVPYLPRRFQPEERHATCATNHNRLLLPM